MHRSVLFALAAIVYFVGPVSGQEQPTAAEPVSVADAELARKVGRLVRQLDHDELAQRDAAEAELLELGPAILDQLPASQGTLSAEQRRRLQRILPALWQAEVALRAKGTKVTLPGKPLTPGEWAAHITRESGITVTWRENVIDPDDPRWTTAVELPLSPEPSFWQVVDALAAKVNGSLYLYTADRSVELMLTDGGQPPVHHSGVARIEAQRVMLDQPLLLTQGEASEPICTVRLELAVEPTMQVVQVQLDTAGFTVTDDEGNPIKFVEERTYQLGMEPLGYTLSLPLRFHAPPRSAKKISKLAGDLTLKVPARVEKLEVASLSFDKPLTVASATTELRIPGITNDDGLWVVPIYFKSLAEAAGDVDSYLANAMEPKARLIDKAGKAFEVNGGYSTLGDSGLELIFVDLPGDISDYHLEVSLPAGLTDINVSFSLQDLPLP